MKIAVTTRIRDGLGRSPLPCAIAAVTLLIAGCGGGGGSTSGGSPSSALTVNLSASPNPVNSGDPATLTWSAPNATACTASGDWNGTQPTSGSVLIPGITNDKVYTLTCTGSGGSGNGSVTVAINQPPVANNRCSSIQNGDTSVGVTLPGSDPNGDGTIASYTVPAAPSNGTIMECAAYPCTRSSPSFTYVPNIVSSLRGMDKFTFTVTDTGGLVSSTTGTVTILNNGQVRIMPLGDSITQGVTNDGACGPDGRCPAMDDRAGYRKNLFNSLEGISPSWSVNFVGSATPAGTNLLADPHNEGRPGFCAAETPDPICTATGNVTNNITNWLNVNPPDIVLLHIGTNDFAHTTSSHIAGILNLIDSWESANYPLTVFVARIIQTANGDLDVGPFNDAVQTMVASRTNDRALMVDLQTGAGLDYSLANDMSDNYHPKQGGYDKMAAKWYTDLSDPTKVGPKYLGLPQCP